MRQAPLMSVLEEAAEPHKDRGKKIHFEALGDPTEQPLIYRKPEIIHGLRNLIQNAVDFARAEVLVEAEWTDDRISLRIIDDGEGFPTHLLGRIGDPFMRNRRTPASSAVRPAYEGMGLGLFIAKTLLERSGAELSFANGLDRPSEGSIREDGPGAIVGVSWHRYRVDAGDRSSQSPIGLNHPISA
jgi:two-component system sensor histidine kinase RegB